MKSVALAKKEQLFWREDTVQNISEFCKMDKSLSDTMEDQNDPPVQEYSWQINKNKLDSCYVLVVDDDELMREILERTIRSLNLHCLVAKNSAEALKLLENNNDIEIVLTDIQMPGMNGIELSKIAKEKYNADIILITGNIEDFSYENAIEEGATDFIKKPISIKELQLRTNRIIAHRALIKERNIVNENRKITLANLQEALDKLRTATGGIIQLLSSVVEVRDPYTSGHQKRVADLARTIATDMGLSEHQIEGVRIAGAIHDIGKIAIPTEILSKPTCLNEFEFELIKTHSQVGYDLLRGIEFQWPIAQIVLQHHRRFDGSGYPVSTSVTESLLEARIIGVADVVEAMASHRPYRPALGLDKALEEIELNKGKLYDPAVVDSCLNVFKYGKHKFN